MKCKVFTIFDSAAGAYLSPFYLNSAGEAVRAFSHNAMNPNTEIYQFAANFTLFEIGEWDDATATIKLYDQKLPLCTALEARSKREAEIEYQKQIIEKSKTDAGKAAEAHVALLAKEAQKKVPQICNSKYAAVLTDKKVYRLKPGKNGKKSKLVEISK